jgi:hypothetical protein
MTQQSADSQFASLVEELTARSLADQMRVAQRYNDLLQRVTTGQLDPAAVRAEYDRLVNEQSSQLARDLTALGVHYYQSILDLNRAYANRLFDDLLSASGGRPENDSGRSEPAAAPPVVDLRLQGRIDEQVQTTFVIENARAEPADVVFLLSEFTGADGEPFRAPLELDPPRLRLAAHSEHPVRLRLLLDSALFAAGRQYHALVVVRGANQLELRLQVDVHD